MAKLSEVPTEELQAELHKRSYKPTAVPNVLPAPDYEKLIYFCKEYINQYAEFGYARDDDKQHIFEAAMTAIFGEDIWTWINKNNQVR